MHSELPTKSFVDSLQCTIEIETSPVCFVPLGVMIPFFLKLESNHQFLQRDENPILESFQPIIRVASLGISCMGSAEPQS